MIIAGAALYLEGTGLVMNNSIIRTSASGRFNQLQCISGSTIADVGVWIVPNGNNITEERDNMFIASIGNASDPGVAAIELQNGVSVTAEDEGVYSCLIRDEDGVQQYLFVGIYLARSNSKSIE